MTKQEYIQQAYGEYWDKVKDYVDEDGWIVDPYYHAIGYPNEAEIFDEILRSLKKSFEYEEMMDRDTPTFRPVSLISHESNNDWLSFVDVDYSFLLKNSGWVYTDKGDIYTIKDYSSLFSICETQKITHYQLIEKPKPPLYD